MKRLKITNNAPLILGFVGISFIATLLNEITHGSSNALLFMTYRSSFLSPLTYLRLFTHVLGHAGFAHFMSNTAYILLLGPMLEEKYGRKKLLEVIAITAVVTAIFNTALFSNTGLCGASGVVFAFILMTSFTSFRSGEFPVTVILVALLYIGDQVVQGIVVKDNISNMAHIIGGIVGAVIGYQLNKKGKPS